MDNKRTQDWQCDTSADLSMINKAKTPVGSTAMILSPEIQLYFMNSEGNWVLA